MLKKVFLLIGAIMLVFVGGLPAADTYFSGADASHSTYKANQMEVYFAGDSNSQVVVLSLDVTQPIVGESITIYDKESTLTLSKAIGVGTSGFVTATNPKLLFDYGDNVIIQTAGGAVQYRVASNMVTASAPYSITLSAGTSSALALGDKIYEMESIGTIKAGASNANSPSLHLDSAVGLIAGTKDSPLLITIVGNANTSGSINSVFGTYK